MAFILFLNIISSWGSEECLHFYRPAAEIIHYGTPKKICLMVLSREGPRTLMDTFTTFEKSKFLSSKLLGTKILYLQEKSGDEYDSFRTWLGTRHNMTILSTPFNIMFKAIKTSLKFCREDFFLFLEEDFQIHSNVKVEIELQRSMDLLDAGVAQAVRLRHRFEPGTPDYLCDNYQISKQAFWKPPHPDCLHRAGLDDAPSCFLWKCGIYFSCMNSLPNDDRWNSSFPSKFIYFTNNPMLYHTAWYKSNIVDKFISKGVDRINVFEGNEKNRSMEVVIQTSDLWLRKPGVTIGKGIGVFTHNRSDRGRMMGSMKRNVLISFATNLEKIDILYLANAFMLYTDLTDDIVLFVKNKNDFKELTDGFIRPLSLLLIDHGDYSSGKNLPPYLDRFYVIYNFLKRNAYSGTVIHTDSRDIILQANPFLWFEKKNGLYTFEEIFDYNNEFNKKWILDCLGETFIKELIVKQQKVICVGITAGKYEVMISYFLSMIEFLSNASSQCFSSSGADTAGHVNIFLNPDFKFPYDRTIMKFGDSPMTHLLGDNKTKNSEGKFLNKIGVPYAIINQFDRYRTEWKIHRRNFFLQHLPANQKLFFFAGNYLDFQPILPVPTQLENRILVVYCIAGRHDMRFLDKQLILYTTACEYGFEIHAAIMTQKLDIRKEHSIHNSTRYFCRRKSTNLPVVTTTPPGGILLSHFRQLFKAMQENYDYFLVQEADITVTLENLIYYKKNYEIMKSFAFHPKGNKEIIPVVPGFIDFEIPSKANRIDLQSLLHMWIYAELFTIFRHENKYYLLFQISRHRFSLIHRDILAKVVSSIYWLGENGDEFSEPNVHFHGRWLARHVFEVIPVEHIKDALTHHASNKYANMAVDGPNPQFHNYQTDVNEFSSVLEFLIGQIDCPRNMRKSAPFKTSYSSTFNWTLSIEMKKNIDYECMNLLRVYANFLGRFDPHSNVATVELQASDCLDWGDWCQLPEKCKAGVKCHPEAAWTRPGSRCLHP